MNPDLSYSKACAFPPLLLSRTWGKQLWEAGEGGPWAPSLGGGRTLFRTWVSRASIFSLRGGDTASRWGEDVLGREDMGYS